MNFNIYLDKNLAKKLISFCKKAHKKRNDVIKEALRTHIHKYPSSVWPVAILEYKGGLEIEPFENTRAELIHNERLAIFE